MNFRLIGVFDPVLGGSHPLAENWRRFSTRYSVRTGDVNCQENRIEGSHLAANLRTEPDPTF
jgi:hypothetical protein